MGKSEVIEVDIHPLFVPVLEDKCLCKSSNLILALGMDPSSERRSRVSIFCRWERFLCISIFNSLPSVSMLRHMNMYDSSSTITSTYHSFWVSVKCCSSLMSLSNLFSRRTLALSEHLTISECGNAPIFPMSSECQFSSWSTEPIEQNSTHWQLGWLVPKRVQLDLPLLQLLERVNEKGVWDVITMLSHWEQSCDTGMIEAAIIIPRIEPGGNSLQTTKSGSTGTEIPLNWVVVNDLNPDYTVRLSWQINLRRQAWWDLPCRQWTISSWNKTGSSNCIRLFINPSQASCR